MLTVVRLDAIRKAREWVTALPFQVPQQVPNLESLPPRHSAEDLLYLVDPDIRKPFDMEEVILRLVDDSRFLTFKPSFGTNLLTGYAQIFGRYPFFTSGASSVVYNTSCRVQCWHHRQSNPCHPR